MDDDVAVAFVEEVLKSGQILHNSSDTGARPVVVTDAPELVHCDRYANLSSTNQRLANW
jgi:hypothetical protein